jgi:hypothetical protein
MRRPRFTLRSLMVAVPIAGLAMWGALWLRSAAFAAMAREHRARCIVHALGQTPIYLGHPYTASDKRYMRYHEERIVYEDRMSRKYRFAALHPWLPVAPDLPTPLDPMGGGRTSRSIATKGWRAPWNWFWFDWCARKLAKE